MFISYHCRYCWLCTSLSPLGIPIIVGMYNNIYIYTLLPAKPKIDRKSEGKSSTTSLINVYNVISFYILFDFFGRYYPPSSKIPLGSGTPKSVSWPVTSLDLTGSGSGCLQMRKRHRSYREHNWSNDLFVLWCSYDVWSVLFMLQFDTIWTNMKLIQFGQTWSLIFGHWSRLSGYQTPSGRFRRSSPSKTRQVLGRWGETGGWGKPSNKLGILTMKYRGIVTIVQNVGSWIQRTAEVHWNGSMGFAATEYCAPPLRLFSLFESKRPMAGKSLGCQWHPLHCASISAGKSSKALFKCWD